MKIEKPLMTLWLLSCVFTCSSGSVRVNRNSSLKNYNRKEKNVASEFFKDPGDGYNLASYDEGNLKLITINKKKKPKTTTVIPKSTSEASEPTCYNVTEVKPEDACGTTKKQKSTKKPGRKKKQTTARNGNTKDSNTKSPLQSDTQDYEGMNKWKKIQKFFFGPPNYPFSKGYTTLGQTTLVPTTMEGLRPIKQELGSIEETTLIVPTFLHPTPNDRSDMGKEEIIKNKLPNKENMIQGENMNFKVQITEVNSCPPKQHMEEMDKISAQREVSQGKITQVNQQVDQLNSTLLHQQSDQPYGVLSLQMNPPNRMLSQQQKNQEDSIASKPQLAEPDKVPSKQQMDQKYILLSLEPKDQQHRITPKHQMDQQDTELSGELIIQKEKVPSRQGIHKVEKTPSNELIVEPGSMTARKFKNEIERISSQENMGRQDNVNNKELLYEEGNIPSNDQIQSKEEINYNDIKDVEGKESLRTVNDPISEAVHDIHEQNIQLNAKEFDAEDIKEDVGVSKFKEYSKQFLKPNNIMELDQTVNKTYGFKPYLWYYQRFMKPNKWQSRNMNKAHEPTFIQSNNPRNDYFTIEKGHVTNDTINSREDKFPYNNFKSNSTNRDANEYQKKITHDSNFFLKTFYQFLKNYFPEMFFHQDIEKLSNRFPPFDKDNHYMSKTKETFPLNTEHKVPPLQNRYSFNTAWKNTELYPTSSLDTVLIFGKPTFHDTQLTESNNQLKERNTNEEGGFKYESTAPALKQINFAILPKQPDKTIQSIDLFEDTSPTSVYQDDANKKNPQDFFYSHYQNGVPPTFSDQTSLSKVNKIFHSAHSTNEPIQKNIFQKEGFEYMATNPTITFTEGHLEFETYLPLTESKTNEYLSSFISSLHPSILNNFWGLQPHNNNTSPGSTTLEAFNDDSIAFDNQHEFNTDHHLKSTPLQPIGNKMTNTEWKEWIPINLPVLRKQFDMTGPSSSQRVTDISSHNQFNIKSELFPFQTVGRGNYSVKPNSNTFISEFDKIETQFINSPVKILETIARENGTSDSKTQPTIDIHSRKMVHEEKQREGTAGLVTESLNELERNLKSFQENSMIYKFKKPQFMVAHNSEPRLMEFHTFAKKIIDKTAEDMVNYVGRPFLKHLNKLTLTGQEFKENVGLNGKGEEGIATQAMERDITDGKKVNNNLQDIVNVEQNKENNETKEPFREKIKYEGLMEDGIHQISSSEGFKELQSEMPNSRYDSVPNLHNMVSSENPTTVLLQEIQPPLKLYDKSIHNHHNEKLLANETGNDNQLLVSSSKPEFYFQDIYNNISLNELEFLKKLFNQSMPGDINRGNPKNEISAVQVSVIKVVNKKPEMLTSRSYMASEKISYKNNNITQMRENMLSQLMPKIRGFFYKLVQNKIIRKRGITDVPVYLDVVGGHTSHNLFQSKLSASMIEKIQAVTLDQIKNKNEHFEREFPGQNSYANYVSHSVSGAEPFYNSVKTSPSKFNDKIQCNDVIRNKRHNKLSDKWRDNMQSLIDMENDKNNLSFDIYDDAVQNDPSKLLSYAINNNLQHLEIPHKMLEKYLGKTLYRLTRNIDDKNRNSNDQCFVQIMPKKIKRNVLGNKKMKSRELEFILEKNLPGLSLNKGQFIKYMMTGMKKCDQPITSEDERISHLSKTYLQDLIDRNARKNKVIVKTSNKRPWQSKL